VGSHNQMTPINIVQGVSSWIGMDGHSREFSVKCTCSLTDITSHTHTHTHESHQLSYGPGHGSSDVHSELKIFTDKFR